MHSSTPDTPALDALISSETAAACSHPAGAALQLHIADEVRQRAARLLARAHAGESQFFTLGDAADAGALPPASRANGFWNRLDAGGAERAARLDALLGDHSAAARARAKIDLAMVGALLCGVADAGWSYVEPTDGASLPGADGMAVAVFHGFIAGLFSGDAQRPLQVDAEGLRALPTARLAQALQVHADNPLDGLTDATLLLRRLGETLAAKPESFVNSPRPGGLFDLLSGSDFDAVSLTAEVDAHEIFSAVVQALAGIWPYEQRIGDVVLGDCWPHSDVRGAGLTDGWMPLHSRSHQVVDAMLPLFEQAGVRVRNADALPGWATGEDAAHWIASGAIVPRDPAALHGAMAMYEPQIVELRALTLALLHAAGDRPSRREASEDTATEGSRPGGSGPDAWHVVPADGSF